MEQLKFRPFNTNSKKLTVTINFDQFYPERNKNGSKNANFILFSISKNLSNFPTIPDHFGRFMNTTDDSRKLTKISEGYRR